MPQDPFTLTLNGRIYAPFTRADGNLTRFFRRSDYRDLLGASPDGNTDA